MWAYFRNSYGFLISLFFLVKKHLINPSHSGAGERKITSLSTAWAKLFCSSKTAFENKRAGDLAHNGVGLPSMYKVLRSIPVLQNKKINMSSTVTWFVLRVHSDSLTPVAWKSATSLLKRYLHTTSHVHNWWMSSSTYNGLWRTSPTRT
jgi:hypothetical protein